MTIAEDAARAGLATIFDAVRGLTEELARPLSPEDQCIQSMPDTSPTKWHRAHTTWFFETFVLSGYDPSYEPVDASYAYLFNSYYEQAGPRHPRPHRGLISRPSALEVARYRERVDEEIARRLAAGMGEDEARLVELGLHHEQQHQELLLMDIKHVLSCNPLQPAYREELEGAAVSTAAPVSCCWTAFDGGVRRLGHAEDGFCFDNELPRHEQVVAAFELAGRPVTCGEWQEFIDDGGYQTPTLWLSDGWDAVRGHGWGAPQYWEHHDGAWTVFTLGGRRAVVPAEPVCHVSYYEADAFARWAGARLPTEAEWEVAATGARFEGAVNDASAGALHPLPARGGGGLQQLYGDVWEWTASPYAPYPGFEPAPGAVGEYNGKFMVNQHVLRGGSCLTPAGHVRPTYRNFFPPGTRWHCSGLRLARTPR